MKKIKVTAVSYLNTKPLLYGIFKSKISQRIDLQLDIPSVCAEKLKTGEADLGLVPVAVIPELDTPYVISDYCIGTIGSVKTVCIYGQCPMEKMTRIFLDHHSRTSVELTRILVEEHWKHDIELVPAHNGYESEIKGTTGGLIIGDRTIGMEEQQPFVYDLGKAWLEYTGLPFVFAAWVSNHPLDDEFIHQFNQALRNGLAEIPQLIYLLPAPTSNFNIEEYFTHHISYELDKPKRKALSLFLEKISPQIQPTLEKSLHLPG